MRPKLSVHKLDTLLNWLHNLLMPYAVRSISNSSPDCAIREKLTEFKWSLIILDKEMDGIDFADFQKDVGELLELFDYIIAQLPFSGNSDVFEAIDWIRNLAELDVPNSSVNVFRA